MKKPDERRGSTYVTVLLVSLAVIAELALVACGGSGSTASSSPSAAASEAAVTATPSPGWSPTMSPAPIPVVKPGDKLPPFAKIAAMYACDTSEPFGTTQGVAYQKGTATVTPIAFNANGRQASGYLVMPQGDGPFPVVLWAPGHGGGFYADMWLPDATKLAKKGYAGLLLDEPAVPFWKFEGPQDVKAFVAYVVQTRRALDLLATMPKIDAQRIGFVGWSTGAVLGSLLSGVDKRIRAFVFDGLHNGDVTTWTAAEQADIKAQGVSLKAYAAQMSLIDPAVYLSHNKDSALLFMWGKDGDAATPSQQKQFVSSAPRATLFMHLGGHGTFPDASKFMAVWIKKNL